MRSSWSIISCQLPRYWLLTGAGWRRSHVNETRRSFWDYRFLDNRLCVTTTSPGPGSVALRSGGSCQPQMALVGPLCFLYIDYANIAAVLFPASFIWSIISHIKILSIWYMCFAGTRNHYTLHKCGWFDILWNPVNSNYGRNFGQPQHRQCLFKVIKDGGDCAGKWIDILSYYHMLCIDFRGESKHTRIFLASPIFHIFLLFIEFLVNQIKSINRSHMCNLKCSAVSSQLR